MDHEALALELETFADIVDAEGLDLKAIQHVISMCHAAAAGAKAGREAGERAVILPRDDWSGAPPGFHEGS